MTWRVPARAADARNSYFGAACQARRDDGMTTPKPVYTLTKIDGTVHTGALGIDVRKVLDRRSDNAPVQVVFEVRTKQGPWIRVWLDELADITAELR